MIVSFFFWIKTYTYGVNNVADLRSIVKIQFIIILNIIGYQNNDILLKLILQSAKNIL